MFFFFSAQRRYWIRPLLCIRLLLHPLLHNGLCLHTDLLCRQVGSTSPPASWYNCQHLDLLYSQVRCTSPPASMSLSTSRSTLVPGKIYITSCFIIFLYIQIYFADKWRLPPLLHHGPCLYPDLPTPRWDLHHLLSRVLRLYSDLHPKRQGRCPLYCPDFVYIKIYIILPLGFVNESKIIHKYENIHYLHFLKGPGKASHKSKDHHRK